jgi:hypothetical protein
MQMTSITNLFAFVPKEFNNFVGNFHNFFNFLIGEDKWN